MTTKDVVTTQATKCRDRFVLSFDVGTKNLAYCLMDNDKNIILWNICDIRHSNKEGRCIKLIECLDQLWYGIPKKNQKAEDIWRQVEVIIEQQMSRNRIMMEVGAQILMYYTMEKIALQQSVKNGEKVKTLISKVITYSPKNKLKVYTKQSGDKPLKPIRAKKPYEIRKNLAKQYCGIIIERNQSKDIISFYEKNKAKADDLADSYLQGVAYIMKV